MLPSSITATAKRKYRAEIDELIEEGEQIQELRGRMQVEENDTVARYIGVEKLAVKRATEFGLKVRRLLRIFHHQLPDAGLHPGEVPMIQLFTDDEAEGERLAGRFWITDVWDSEPTDPIERRCGIDLQGIREVVTWLQVLAAKLELGSGQRDAPPGVPKTSESARTKDRVRALRRDGLSFEKICQLLDERREGDERVSMPQNARWRHLKWSVAYRTCNKAVKSWFSKTCKGITVTRLLR